MRSLGRAKILIDKRSLSLIGVGVAVVKLKHRMYGGKARTEDTGTIAVMAAQR